VAVADIAATTGTGELEVSGVHRLTALSTDTGSIGDVVWWDTTNTRITVTRGSNHVYAGRFAAAKANGDTTADVRPQRRRPADRPALQPGGGRHGADQQTTETALDSFRSRRTR
jgi:predicted RecA/RadA family phage recombinase